jgi:pyruvate, orthophosphate dikinase
MAKKLVKKTRTSGSTRTSRTSRVSARTSARPRRRGGREKYVYFFGNGKADGDRTMKDLLGGKGSGLAEMTNAGLPVPPGFTISTEACTLFYQQKRRTPDVVDGQMIENLRKLEQAVGAKLGDVNNPLLVSVRSGAKFSMPGMMDTILNLGMNDQTVAGIKARTKNGRFAWDSYRRFIQMYGNVVLEIPKDAFEHTFEARSSRRTARRSTPTSPRSTSRRSSRTTRRSCRTRPARSSRRIRSRSSRRP